MVVGMTVIRGEPADKQSLSCRLQSIAEVNGPSDLNGPVLDLHNLLNEHSSGSLSDSTLRRIYYLLAASQDSIK